jgi:transcriptional regulator with XRE-family HTH domain
MSREYIANVLKRLRKAKGYTADQVGELIGKSGKTVNAWENNHGQPDAEMLMMLCDIYEVKDILNEFRETPNTKTPPPLTAEENRLLNAFSKLNQNGKQEAVNRVEELTEISKYTFSAQSSAEEAI